MDERKHLASEQTRLLKDQASAKTQQAAQLTQRIAEMKKAPLWEQEAIAEIEAKIKAPCP